MLPALIVIATAALLGYRFLWHHLQRLPVGAELSPRRTRGRIAALGTGWLLLAQDEGEQLFVTTDGARQMAWPGPGAWRIATTLRVGDPVSLLLLDDATGVAAVRIVRGAWPPPPCAHVPSAVLLTLMGIALLQLVSTERVAVETEVDPPAGSSFVFDAPTDPEGLYAKTRRLASAHPWAGEGSPLLETGQSFHDYVGTDPNVADLHRRFLYIQPVGPFSPSQELALRRTAGFLARFFCLPVRVADAVPLSTVPEVAQRVHPEWNNPQLLTSYVMHHLLRRRRPDDAAGYLGITAVDIWPGRGWEAVYGQASPVERVGIVSMYRSGELDAGPAMARLALLRTIKVAAHETGHMLSMQHCARRGCLMSGHNDREEADLRYPVLCPDCLAKLLWATRCDPVEHYAALASFSWQQGLADEAAVYARLLDAAVLVWGRPKERPQLAGSF